MRDPLKLFKKAADLHLKGKLAAAEALYLQLLAEQPGHFDARHLLGVLQHQQGRSTEALASIGAALRTHSDFPPALLNQAVVLRALGRPAEALAGLERALAIKPDYAEAFYNLGLTLGDLHRAAEALASFEQALAIRPDYIEALLRRASTLRELNRAEEALASFDAVLRLRPGDHDVLINRGNVLRILNRPAEALSSYEAALAIRPHHAGTHYNRGNALVDLNRPGEALTSFEQALAIEPAYVDALNNRAGALRSLGRPADALASFDRALALAPDDAEAHLNRACVRLLLGDFERGLAEYEWRWRTPSAARFRREFVQPLWLGGETLEGRTILLHAEQGLGDALQFVRYAPLVAARGGKVVLEVQPPLKSLLAGVAGVSLVLAKGESLPEFDCHCPLASLPLAFGTRLGTIPAKIPYLEAAKERVERWRERLPRSGVRRIAIAWAGNAAFHGDQGRSIGLARLLPLLPLAGAEFISIQKDLRPGDRELLARHPAIAHHGDAITDFSDTAAILSLVDLVISSDTSVVHLAGALGRPVFILLQRAADWRWLADRADSPWYPTARLFRQPTAGDWESVLEQLRAELERGAAPAGG